MTTIALRAATVASVSVLRTLFATLHRTGRCLAAIMTNFNRYMDAAHKVPGREL